MQTKRWIITGLSLCLLSLQLSGLHLHVSMDDSADDSHRPHLHQSNPDNETEHDKDIDVELTGAGIIWKKYSFILALLTFALLVIRPVTVNNWISHSQCLSSLSREHWRPPLRAPPLFSISL